MTKAEFVVKVEQEINTALDNNIMHGGIELVESFDHCALYSDGPGVFGVCMQWWYETHIRMGRCSQDIPLQYVVDHIVI